MRLDDEKERLFYEIESEEHNWSVRELNRRIKTPGFRSNANVCQLL